MGPVDVVWRQKRIRERESEREEEWTIGMEADLNTLRKERWPGINTLSHALSARRGNQGRIKNLAGETEVKDAPLTQYKVLLCCHSFIFSPFRVR